MAFHAPIQEPYPHSFVARDSMQLPMEVWGQQNVLNVPVGQHVHSHPLLLITVQVATILTQQGQQYALDVQQVMSVLIHR